MRTDRRSRRPSVTHRHVAAEVLEGRTLLTAYVVDTLADSVAADGKVSLREAILAANANVAVNEAAAGQGGGVTDSVTFASSISGGTVTLGGTELDVTDHLLITGPITVSANQLSRVFGVTAGTAVTLSGVSIKNGGGAGSVAGFRIAEGGGIYNAGVLNLTGCTLETNSAGTGGAVFNTVGGSLSVVGSVVRSNSANSGGGVANAAGAAASVRDSTLSNNSAGVNGAAVFNAGVLAMSGSGLTGNNTSAVYNNGSATVSGCLMTSNDTAVVNAGNMTVTGGQISGNTSTGAVNFNQLTLTDVPVSGNGFGVVNTETLRISGGRIAGNGGGLDNSGGADIFGCVISGNTGVLGGGIYNHQGALTLTQSIVQDNTANTGGGIYSDSHSIASISDCLIAGNTAVSPLIAAEDRNSGGGIWNAGGLTLLRSVVSRNTVARYGGGIFNWTEGRLTVADTILAQNQAAAGGGLLVAAGSVQARISRSTFTGNTAASGGGVYDNALTELYNSTLSGNYATGVGGGIRKSAGSAMPLLNVTVFGNRAGVAGGGISTAASLVRLQGTLVAGNRRGLAGTTGTPDDVTGTLAAASDHSLIGDAATAGGLVNGVNSNIVGVDWADVIDPVLRYNGGPTPTHALIADSPAINAGGTSPFTTDQRGPGFPRPVGGASDIGAFEFQAVAVATAGAALRASDNEPLAAFWAQDEDEAFAAALAAV